jgi:hypothetical protein
MDDLTMLLQEAVEDVEPTDRRAELRELVAVSTKSRHRRYAITGGLLAAAVVVTGVAIGMQRSDGPETEPSNPGRAVDRSRDHRPAYGLYYIGETPQGRRLFREYRTGPGPETTPAAAISLLQSAPDDPDYWTLWPTGTFSDARVVGDVIQVDIADPASVATRLDGMSAKDAELSVDQVIYTVQAAVQAELSVQFTHDGSPVAHVLGMSTSEPLARGAQLEVLALASISDPSERRVVEDSFSANGRASSFEGTVPWELRDSDGSVVDSGTAESFGDVDRLYPWATGPIDVSDLDPGTYTFVVMTADPSDGEGPGPTVDTRTVIIK